MLFRSLICFISFMISVVAPGNAVRQSVNEKMPTLNAILYSFGYAYKFIKETTNISMIWFYVFLIPILLEIGKKINFKFKMPLLFTIFTFCLFSAQFTPPVYALNGSIPRRLLDIIYYSQYWLIILNIGYWLGYIKEKVNITQNKKSDLYIYIIMLILGVFIVKLEYKESTSWIAIKDLQTGVVQKYDYEMKQTEKLYNDKSLKDIQVKRLTVRPYLLFFSDIGYEPWYEEVLKQFYDKNSVKLLYE